MAEPGETRWNWRQPRFRRALVLLGLAVLGASLAYSGFLEPAAGRLVPRCPTNAWFGLYCPACGGTRAIMHLLQFELLAALRHNAPVVLGLPLAAWIYVSGTDLTARPWRRWEILLLIAAISLFTLLRNLPWPPFSLLAPPPSIH